MRLNGFDEDWTKHMLEASYMRLSVTDYVALYRREYITKDDLEQLLKYCGLNSWDIAQVLDLTQYFPSPQDLISFAIRDVYTPAIIDEYKLYEDMPELYLKEAAKTGLSEDFAKKYWGSHWNLPSPGQVFQMLQRRVTKPNGDIFNVDDIRLYLKTADFSPQWRDMLTQISYQPLTRVDTRRMYSFGILTREQVEGNFLDQGYSPANAKLMTDFTIVHDDPDTTGQTRTNIMAAYVEGIIQLDDLVSMLGDIGIQAKALQYWIGIAQYDKAQAEVKKVITRYTEAYLTGSQDLDTIRTKLHTADLPSAYVDKILDDMLQAKLAARKVPPVDTLVAWLVSGTIDDKAFHGRMRLLGYNDEDISFYMTTIVNNGGTLHRKFLKDTLYKQWFVDGIIDETYFRTTLTSMGISATDIDRYVIDVRRLQNAAKGST
jgi:hypothetical protein